jgi:dihydrolipoamide dehydrogenase
MPDTFDVVVIGAAQGVYTAAISAEPLGLKTFRDSPQKAADSEPAPGGTCTNVGCIPSKALLQSSENYEQASHDFAEHGIEVKGLALDLKQMLARKSKVVRQNNDGIVYLFKKNKITFYNGVGSFAGSDAGGWKLSVGGDKPDQLVAKHVIVATGSKPRALPGAAFDNKLILDNDGALAIPEVPKSLGVIGAGVVGLEMGSVWRRLGAKVTVLEALPAFLGAADEQVAKEAWKLFGKQGLSIELGVKISAVRTGANVVVDYADAAGKPSSAAFDKLIVSIGRVPHTAGLGAEAVGLKLDERGFVAVDADCRTSLPNVWAIGDVVRGPMLAHKAEEEGVAVAERSPANTGTSIQHGAVGDLHVLEIAWVGRSSSSRPPASPIAQDRSRSAPTAGLGR